MAKAATETKTPEAAEQRTFDFDTFDTSVPVPEKLPTQRASSLPFQELFTKMLPDALEGKQPHKFIPTAFWVQRAVDTKGNVEKATEPGYGKGKLRGQFNEWVKKGESGSATNVRASLNLVMLHRTGKEDGYKEPGISLWLTKST